MIDRIKYPRTYHVPWSPGLKNDDRMSDPTHLDWLVKHNLSISLKRDGENTTIYQDGQTHARSLDSVNHPSREWLRSFAPQWCWALPGGHRVCGENLYALHSIFYEELESYFQAFSIWSGDVCLSLEETRAILEEVERQSTVKVHMVPEVWTGCPGTVDGLKHVMDSLLAQYPEEEGLVVRNVESFLHRDFQLNTTKWVRKDHVQTDSHWLAGPVVPNKLRDQNVLHSIQDNKHP